MARQEPTYSKKRDIGDRVMSQVLLRLEMLSIAIRKTIDCEAFQRHGLQRESCPHGSSCALNAPHIFFLTS